MEPMDIVGRTKEDASLPKGSFHSYFLVFICVFFHVHIFSYACMCVFFPLPLVLLSSRLSIIFWFWFGSYLRCAGAVYGLGFR